MKTGTKIVLWAVGLYFLFRGNDAASIAGGSSLISVPSNLLSSDFGGTAEPTAANDPLGLAIGATPTPGGFFDAPFGPPAPLDAPTGGGTGCGGGPCVLPAAPGEINAANTEAGQAAAAQVSNTLTGAQMLPLTDSPDLSHLAFEHVLEGVVVA